ncbi:MAG: prepilin-type N-terminal cleavage/methylation domain-containing protein, partial [Xanthomonadales bacterium]|nr:prepilin-type N-terminal cleavage/methylation domain-containing protein [Xanthomonadales bacterium]
QEKGKRKREKGTARAVAPLFPFSVSHFPAGGRRRGRQQGFTLIEVLVAFIVFVLIFGAVLDALGMAMRNTRRSAEVSEAALWAQSKLDAVGTIEELEEGNERGEFNQQFRWELDIRKQEVPRTDGLASDTFPVDLYRVDLTVSWGDANQRKEQHFITLRSKLKEGQF